MITGHRVTETQSRNGFFLCDSVSLWLCEGEGSCRRVVGITAGLLTAAPPSALACPVCALVGTSDNTWAYQAMSAMLTLLPLAMVGATVWWLARLAARADAERPSATQHIVDDSLVQATSPTRRGPRPVGSCR